MELPVAFCDEMKRILGDEYEDYLKSCKYSEDFCGGFFENFSV